MSSEEPYVEPLGLYKPWNVREIPDNELDEQLALFTKEKERRRAIEDEGRQIDEFFTHMRALKGIQPIGHGEEWFDPDGDMFSSYPLGAVVEHEGKFYKSRRHGNMMPPHLTVWWEAYTPKPGEFDHDV